MHNYYLHLKQIHNIVDVDFSVNKNQLREQIEEMNKSDFAVITNTIKEDMISCIEKARENEKIEEN